MLTQNLPDFWERKYIDGNDDWDLGKVSAGLVDYFSHESCPQAGRVLVPGAGRGYDAIAWAQKGHEVLAVDFCPTAVDALDSLSRKNDNLTSVDTDLFELDVKKHGQFDVIYEYTCFSAIHPGRRDEYFEVWEKMLKDDGVVIARFFPLNNNSAMEGPPHATSEGELMARLGGIFELEARITPTTSPEGREGNEEIWLLKKTQ
jgi:SAM-dependent methyltransferase